MSLMLGCPDVGSCYGSNVSRLANLRMDPTTQVFPDLPEAPHRLLSRRSRLQPANTDEPLSD